MLHFLFVCLLAQLWSTFNTVHVSSVLHFSGFRREAKGAAKPLFISCIFKMFYNYSAILLSKSFNKMLFNSTFRAVNFIYYPLHHEYAHNAVCCMSRKVKFSFGSGGWGRTWPPLTDFSGSAPVRYILELISYLTFNILRNFLNNDNIFVVDPNTKNNTKVEFTPCLHHISHDLPNVQQWLLW